MDKGKKRKGQNSREFDKGIAIGAVGGAIAVDEEAIVSLWKFASVFFSPVFFNLMRR